MKTWQKWLVSCTLVVAVLGGAAYGIHARYQPLLFVVGNEAMRQAEWTDLRPELLAGIPYTRSDDLQTLERRSMEELILSAAKKNGVTYDEKILNQQLSQFGSTPDERAQKLAEMNTTEAKVRVNYERSLTAFALKTMMTADVKVSEDEINTYYEQNKGLFLAPEFRSVYYLRGKVSDTELVNTLSGATATTFPDLVKSYNDEAKNRTGTWHELDGLDHLTSHTSQRVAEVAFQAPLNKVVGPFQDNDWNYWYMISEIKEPHQFTLMEERDKIQSSLLQEKQLAKYRAWLETQKEIIGYHYFPENLDREPLRAFWHDLPQNFKIWF
ncbi:peptidyl-prolyl cis-trans isomerase [Tumebacillus permanentifrigoris]|nr:peptidylprolyl isomerase [Tumebacillus permanentifrigoris]